LWPSLYLLLCHVVPQCRATNLFLSRLYRPSVLEGTPSLVSLKKTPLLCLVCSDLGTRYFVAIALPGFRGGTKHVPRGSHAGLRAKLSAQATGRRQPCQPQEVSGPVINQPPELLSHPAAGRLWCTVQGRISSICHCTRVASALAQQLARRRRTRLSWRGGEV
jgi:hypothetical protein